MKLFTPVFLLTFLLSCPAFSQIDHEYVLKALNYQENQEYEKAVVYYTRAIDFGGSMASIPEIYLERGTCYYKMNEFRKALYDLDQGLQLDNSNFYLYLQRAMVFYSLVKPEYAIQDFQDALRFADADSTRMAIHLNIGSAKMMKRDFSGAREEFDFILQRDSSHVGALTNIGVALNNMGQPGQALYYLKKAVEIDPNDPAGHINIGFHFLRIHQYAASIPYFDKALELQPDAPLAFSNRSFAKFKMGQTTEALNDINKSLRLFPTNAYAYKNRALIFLELGYTEKACQDLQLALKYKFTEQYGSEVEQLIENNCN